MKRPGVPLVKSSELKSLEEFATYLALVAQGLPDGVREQASAASKAANSRSQMKMRAGLISSGSLNIVLVIALGLMALYYRGYDRGKQDAEAVKVVVPDAPIVPAPPLVIQTDAALEETRSLLAALVLVHAEHQKYLDAVIVAQAARKKTPSKPQSLMDAEQALVQLQEKAQK